MLTAALAILMTAPQVKLPPMQTVTLGIFMRGTRPQGISQDALAEMQKGHIANLERLYRERKSPAAGPFENGGDRRGIVILEMQAKAAAQEFEQDPFVKDGLLKLEFYEWMVPKGMFGYPSAESFEMQKVMFAWVSKGPNYQDPPRDLDNQNFPAHVNLNLDLMRQGRGLIGPLTTANPWALGVYILETSEEKTMRAWLESDPHLKSGRLQLNHLALYMGKGLFKRLTP